MDPRCRVEKALQEEGTLPAGPEVMARIDELSRDPNSSARDLGKVLQLDQALTTRVLKQVNSSFYGLAATIKTVTHAVVILGFQQVKNIALTVPVADLYQQNLGASGIDVGRLWDQTVKIACLARTLSYHINHPVPEQVFVKGILSNAGMVVLNNILGPEYAAVVKACADEEALPAAEEAAFGISHAEVGRVLAEKWHFPEDLVRAIAHHHEPIQEEEILEDAGLLYVARCLHRYTENGGEDFAAALAQIPEKLVAAFSLTPKAIERACQKAEKEYEEARQRLTAK